MAKRHPGRLVDHGAGKGDADRTQNVRAFNQNFEGINWTRKGPAADSGKPESASEVVLDEPGRFVKRYGPKAIEQQSKGPHIKVL